MGVFARFDDNDFRWWITRQLDATDLAGVFDTLSLRDRGGTNAWYAAREARHETSGYTADLEAVVAAAGSVPASTGAVVQRTGFAFLQKLLAELGARVGPELASALVAYQVWTLEQAFAWARRSSNPRQTLLVVDELLQRDDGTLRDRLLAEAVAAGARVVDESGPPLLARIAAHADPHVQALLLETMRDQPDKGGLAMGLRDIVPVLDPDLLDLARSIALKISSLTSRVEMLALIAGARPPEEADAAYAEVLDLVGSEGGEQAPDFDRALTLLARELPEDRLDDLGALVDKLIDSGHGALVTAATIEGRRLDPDEALALAASIDGSVDDQAVSAIRVAVARRQADAGNTAAALAALHLSAESPPRFGDAYDALGYIVERAGDVEDARLLTTLGRLEPDALTPLLRTLGAHVHGPAPALRAFAMRRDAGSRAEAMAAVAGCLEPSDIDDAIRSILDSQFIDARPLADLAPYLDLGQAERILQSVVSPGTYVLLDAKLAGPLLARMAVLAGPDCAIDALTELPPSIRGDTLAHILDAVPGDRLARVLQDVMQPDRLEAARAGARTALAGALTPQRVEGFVDQVAALDQPLDKARALARLAARGQPTALAQLPDALTALASEDVDELALDLLLTSAASCPGLRPRLVDVVPGFDNAGIRASVYLNLARAERSRAADRASRLLIEELLADPDICLPAGGEWSDPNGRQVSWPTPPDPSSLVAALQITDDASDEARAMAVVELAPFLGDRGRIEINRHVERWSPLARMFARATLARLEPAIAHECAQDGLEAVGPCPHGFDEALVWLDYLDAAGLDPGPEIVGSIWAGAVEEDARTIPGRLAALASLHLRPDTEMITRAVHAVLQYPDRQLGNAIVALLPALAAPDLRLILDELQSRSEPPWRAVIAGAAQAGLLGDDDLAAAFFDLLDSDDWWWVSLVSDQGDDDGYLVRTAVARLSEAALRRVVEQAPDRSSAIELAVLGAAAGGHETMVRELLETFPPGDTPEGLFDRVVPYAPPTWEPWLAPMLRGSRTATALAAYAARHPPDDGLRLLVDALESAAPWDRGKIIAEHHDLAAGLPADRLWSLWLRVLDDTDSRQDILGAIETWAGVLIAVLGPAVAVALDDAITLLATDEWPTSHPASSVSQGSR